MPLVLQGFDIENDHEIAFSLIVITVPSPPPLPIGAASPEGAESETGSKCPESALITRARNFREHGGQQGEDFTTLGERPTGREIRDFGIGLRQGAA